jgi:hypothetical protein
VRFYQIEEGTTMPIDPKKFKKAVASHFKNVNEEEFLKNLRKFPPCLFDEGLLDTAECPNRAQSDLKENQ